MREREIRENRKLQHSDDASRNQTACSWQTLALPRNPGGLTASQSRLADILTTAAVPGRSAALDVCVASSIAAAAQAALDRKLSHYRK